MHYLIFLWTMALLCFSQAQAASSDASVLYTDLQEVTFVTDQEIFRTEAVDTGWMPSEWSPFAIRFEADTVGYLVLDQVGQSAISWPSAFSQNWRSIENGGFANLETWTDLSADLRVHWSDTHYEGTIWSNSFDWAALGSFTSLLLPGHDSQVLEATGTGPAQIAETLLYVGDMAVYFGAEFEPETTVKILGTGLQTNAINYVSSTESIQLPAPHDNQGFLPLSSEWRGLATGEVNMNFTGYLDVAIGGWWISVKKFEDSWHITSESTELFSEIVDYSHEIPAIQTDAARLHFGKVAMGDRKEMTVQIDNLGELELEGAATVTTGIDFWLPKDLIRVIDHDTLSVAFSPSSLGVIEDELILTTNDPVRPTIHIQLMGTGVEEPLTQNSSPDRGDELPGANNCGCSAAGPLSPIAALGAGLLAFFIRRRR